MQMYFCTTDALGQIWKMFGREEMLDSKQQLCIIFAALVLYNPNAALSEQALKSMLCVVYPLF